MCKGSEDEFQQEARQENNFMYQRVNMKASAKRLLNGKKSGKKCEKQEMLTKNINNIGLHACITMCCHQCNCVVSNHYKNTEFHCQYYNGKSS